MYSCSNRHNQKAHSRRLFRVEGSSNTKSLLEEFEHDDVAGAGHYEFDKRVAWKKRYKRVKFLLLGPHNKPPHTSKNGKELTKQREEWCGALSEEMFEPAKKYVCMSVYGVQINHLGKPDRTRYIVR